MILFFVTLLVLAFIVLVISFWGQETLLHNGGGQWRRIRVILFAVLLVLPLLCMAYLVLFVATIPASILVFGFGVVTALYGILHSFYASAKRRKEAFRKKQFSLLKQHIRAREIEQQVADWKRNYGR